MATLAFVLLFVVLGLGALLAAMRGGPRSAARAARERSRKTRPAALVAFVVAILVLGAGIPAAVIATVKDRDSDPADDIATLTPQEKHGRVLFGRICSYCHTLAAANAVAQVGPDLDTLRPPKALVLDAIKNGRARGNGQMAAGLYQGQDAEDVADFVAAAVGQSTK